MLLTAFPSWRLAAMNSSISSIVIASSSKRAEGRDEMDARVALVVHQRRALETDELAVGEVAARELREQQPAGRAGARHGAGHVGDVRSDATGRSEPAVIESGRMGADTSCAGPGLFTQRPAVSFWTTKCSGNGLFKPFPSLMSLWGPVERAPASRWCPRRQGVLERWLACSSIGSTYRGGKDIRPVAQWIEQRVHCSHGVEPYIDGGVTDRPLKLRGAAQTCLTRC